MTVRDRLETIRARWRGQRFGSLRPSHDGVAWRLDSDRFFGRAAVEALASAPDDVAWLLAEVDRLRGAAAAEGDEGDPT